MITRVFSNNFVIVSGFCLWHLSIAEVYLLIKSGPYLEQLDIYIRPAQGIYDVFWKPG